ncbi:unnamed protein product [Leptidea sinapis]|uniref:Uncharacterized protein n=1 Tax=Leptidea sinapis TaxID=189913 RepID=A0A5E4R613_9NEOP|nr:unnamed protein product [Leptidea sinapis]
MNLGSLKKNYLNYVDGIILIKNYGGLSLENSFCLHNIIANVTCSIDSSFHIGNYLIICTDLLCIIFFTLPIIIINITLETKKIYIIKIQILFFFIKNRAYHPYKLKTC